MILPIITVLIIIMSLVYLVNYLDKISIQKKRQAYIKKLTEAADLKFKALTEKYDKETAAKLVNGEYWVGMTKEQVIESKGRKPEFIDFDHGKKKTVEHWIYNNDHFYFENNITTRIIDRPDNDHPVKVQLN